MVFGASPRGMSHSVSLHGAPGAAEPRDADKRRGL